MTVPKCNHIVYVITITLFFCDQENPCMRADWLVRPIDSLAHLYQNTRFACQLVQN